VCCDFVECTDALQQVPAELSKKLTCKQGDVENSVIGLLSSMVKMKAGLESTQIMFLTQKKQVLHKQCLTSNTPQGFCRLASLAEHSRQHDSSPDRP
jgi:hypothetical protein